MPKVQHCWYSPEQKMEIVQKYLGSSTNVETFCKNEGIAKSTLYKWVKIYNEANSTEALPAKAFQDVTPIIKQDVTSIMRTTTMKLTLPNNMILEFESSELHNVLVELK